MTNEQKRPLFLELDRQTRFIVDFTNRWPEERHRMAAELLGSAIGTCDTFGVDVQEVIANIRKAAPMPPVLVPPKGKQS